MIRYLTVPVLVAAALALSACTSVPPSPQTLRNWGHALVEQKCSGCHAVDMEDYSPNSAAPRFRDLYAHYPLDRLEKAFAKGIFHVGRHEMPSFLLTSNEGKQILAYLISINPCASPSAANLALKRCSVPIPAKR